jgi:hypothetical protein
MFQSLRRRLQLQKIKLILYAIENPNRYNSRVHTVQSGYTICNNNNNSIDSDSYGHTQEANCSGKEAEKEQQDFIVITLSKIPFFGDVLQDLVILEKRRHFDLYAIDNNC